MSNIAGGSGDYGISGGSGAYNGGDQLNNTMNYAYPDRGAYNSSLVGGGGNYGHTSSSKHMSELDIAKIVA